VHHASCASKLSFLLTLDVPYRTTSEVTGFERRQWNHHPSSCLPRREPKTLRFWSSSPFKVYKVSLRSERDGQALGVDSAKSQARAKSRHVLILDLTSLVRQNPEEHGGWGVGDQIKATRHILAQIWGMECSQMKKLLRLSNTHDGCATCQLHVDFQFRM
jgi:hypothetical protein